MNRVEFGIDAALRSGDLRNWRIGLVTNEAAKTAAEPRQSSRTALLKAGIKLIRLFSPEHGLAAKAADGAAVADGTDAPTGLPITSLYGDRMRPPAETMTELEAMVFDIPDIGARFYTYIWTLWHTLEACAALGKPLIVLDRPNPLSGLMAMAEGPLLEVARCGSFLGRAEIPTRHCLTAGELARLWNSELAAQADLRVIPCAGWRRKDYWPDTGLPFERTSPAMPDYHAALLYPGMCLFEATNLSVGRGTDWPFQMAGAPWMDSGEVARLFNELGLPGLKAEAMEIMPTQNPWANTPGRFVRLKVIKPRTVRPVAAGLALLATIIAHQREHFRWAAYPTAANPKGQGHFERLIGRTGIREILEDNPSKAFDQLQNWTAAPGWPERVKPFLLYE